MDPHRSSSIDDGLLSIFVESKPLDKGVRIWHDHEGSGRIPSGNAYTLSAGQFLHQACPRDRIGLLLGDYAVKNLFLQHDPFGRLAEAVLSAILLELIGGRSRGLM